MPPQPRAFPQPKPANLFTNPDLMSDLLPYLLDNPAAAAALQIASKEIAKTTTKAATMVTEANPVTFQEKQVLNGTIPLTEANIAKFIARINSKTISPSDLSKLNCTPTILARLIKACPGFPINGVSLNISLNDDFELIDLHALLNNQTITFDQITKCSCKLYTNLMDNFFNDFKAKLISLKTLSIDKIQSQDFRLFPGAFGVPRSNVFDLTLDELIIKDYRSLSPDPANPQPWEFPNIKNLTIKNFHSGADLPSCQTLENLTIENIEISEGNTKFHIYQTHGHAPLPNLKSIDINAVTASKKNPPKDSCLILIESLTHLESVRIGNMNDLNISTSIKIDDLPKLTTVEIKTPPPSFDVDIPIYESPLTSVKVPSSFDAYIFNNWPNLRNALHGFFNLFKF